MRQSGEDQPPALSSRPRTEKCRLIFEEVPARCRIPWQSTWNDHEIRCGPYHRPKGNLYVSMVEECATLAPFTQSFGNSWPLSRAQSLNSRGQGISAGFDLHECMLITQSDYDSIDFRTCQLDGIILARAIIRASKFVGGFEAMASSHSASQINDKRLVSPGEPKSCCESGREVTPLWI